MNDRPLPEALQAAIDAAEDGGPHEDITLEELTGWMSSDDLEVLGAAFHLLGMRRFFERVRPPLAFEQYMDFVIRYHERCFLENPRDGEWAMTRYEAGWSLVGWFIGLWDDPAVDRSFAQKAKDWLARLYREGDAELRTCLVTTTLEHLFERRDIAKYFSDWKNEPGLQTAYREATEWSEKGGRALPFMLKPGP